MNMKRIQSQIVFFWGGIPPPTIKYRQTGVTRYVAGIIIYLVID